MSLAELNLHEIKWARSKWISKKIDWIKQARRIEFVWN